MRVAIITDGDQESAFPLPDYAQEVQQKNRQTDVYLYFVSEGAGKVRPGSFFGRRGARTMSKKKSCGFRFCSVVKASGWPSDNNDSNDQEWSPGFFVPKNGHLPIRGRFPGRVQARRRSEIRYYRENINTAGDARQCELRVAIITDRDQESAFPLPDYAQVYNNKNKQTDRTDKHILYIHSL